MEVVDSIHHPSLARAFLVAPVLSVKWWNPRRVLTIRVPFHSVVHPLRVMTSSVSLALCAWWTVLRAIALAVNLVPFANPRIKGFAMQGKPMITKRENVCPIPVKLRMCVIYCIKKGSIQSCSRVSCLWKQLLTSNFHLSVIASLSIFLSGLSC